MNYSQLPRARLFVKYFVAMAPDKKQCEPLGGLGFQLGTTMAVPSITSNIITLYTTRVYVLAGEQKLKLGLTRGRFEAKVS